MVRTKLKKKKLFTEPSDTAENTSHPRYITFKEFLFNFAKGKQTFTSALTAAGLKDVTDQIDFKSLEKSCEV